MSSVRSEVGLAMFRPFRFPQVISCESVVLVLCSCMYKRLGHLEPLAPIDISTDLELVTGFEPATC